MASSRTLRRNLALLGAGLLLFSYIGYQAYRLHSSPFETQTAEYDTVTETIRTEGIALRDELTMPLMTDNVLVYNYANGAKVGVHSALAYEYESEEAAQNKQLMDELQVELQNLETLQNLQGSSNSNLDNLTKQISEKANQLIDLADSSVTEGLSAIKEDLTFLFNKKQVALHQGESFEKRLTYLENQLAYLEESAGTPANILYTPAEGYFSKMVDGYENLYTIDQLQDLDLEHFQQLLNIDAHRQGDYVGKVVKNQNWYFVVTVDNRELEYFEQGQTAILDFGFATGQEVEATIYQVRSDEEAGRSLVIFRSKEINEDLLELRKQSVDITFRSYSGLRVDREALCYEQSILGVYVLERDAIVRFKPISVLRDQGSYVLCQGIGEDANCLKRFDEVIINGGKLEDGSKIK